MVNGALKAHPLCLAGAHGMMKKLLFLFLCLIPTLAQAQTDDPWRLSLYGGIATRNDTSQIFLHGHYHPDGNQIGLSLDRDIAKLGERWTLVGEWQATRFVYKSHETSVELGLGARYDMHLFGDPFSISAFTGPSWADGEPVISTGSWHGAPINFKRAPWLNYVGAEFALAIAPQWNAVARFYHRSGAFGLFQPQADEGSTLGFGLQYKF